MARPEYKDKNTDAEEYDSYHDVDGLPTPFTVTRFKNEEMVRQFFIDKVRSTSLAPRYLGRGRDRKAYQEVMAPHGR